MADQVAPAAGGDAAAAAPAEQPGMWGMLKGMLRNMFFFWCVSSLLKGFTGGGQGQGNSTAPAAAGGARFPPSRNLFPVGQLYDFYMYLSPEESRFELFDETPFWQELGIKYGSWEGGPNNDGSFEIAKTFPTPESLQNNGSLYLHVFVTKSGQSPNPKDRSYVKREVIYGNQQLNKYKKKFYKKTANLITGKSDKTDEELAKAEVMKFEVLNFWHPNLTINLVDDQTNWSKGSLPAPLDEAVKFDPTGMFYKPILFFNNYWNLGADYQPINDTVKEVNLTLTFSPMSLFKYQLYASQQMRNKWSSLMSGDFFEDDAAGDDQDQIKQALLETSPYLLGITVVVSLLHTVFEFLAFKNDIQFWRSRKSLEGLSVRSVVFGIFQSAIVFLYICDNDTNFVIKCSVFVGLIIEMWKIQKVMDVTVDYQNKYFGIIPRLNFADKGSYLESDTKVYDQMAFKYLSWLLFPLLGGYAVYSVMYNEHRGWYSFVLSMLYGFLLTFGFITMTPQLFINYKLKSVAHLPWRMLSYKFINTFIDDLFAFVIKMPTMYRIGCFRDDIVFLVYLYQRWAYRVDPKRTNEFGTSGEHPTGVPLTEEEQKAIDAAAAAKAAEPAAEAVAEPTPEEKKTN
ncbi:unnamed protein product, partial [Mesorhabditis spiculigera]